MLFSSLSRKRYIENILKKNLFEFDYVGTDSHFFEKLYVVKITKSDILKRITNSKVSSIKYLVSGKHSIVLKGNFKKNNVIIKTGKKQHLEKERFFMKAEFHYTTGNTCYESDNGQFSSMDKNAVEFFENNGFDVNKMSKTDKLYWFNKGYLKVDSFFS